MKPKVATAFRLDHELVEAMRRVKETEGVSTTAQMELALLAWLTKRGALKRRKLMRA
jgi:hypothetical protein